MITKNIEEYFKKKSDNLETGHAPKGICPNCWGKQEWDGHFYELMKAKNVTLKSDTYNSFIKEIVTKHINGIALKKDTYKCSTCKIDYTKGQ